MPIYIRTSSFKLPKSASIPIIMVGPGTGLAPFRGFVRERFYEASNGTTVGPTWLFYGCRNSEEVFLQIYT
jgi:NADPH-ferrihemoprotein reductase